MKIATWPSTKCVDEHLISGTVLESKSDVAEFMKGRPDPDQEITWVCAECHSKNTDTYHHRSSKCPVCGKSSFPRVPTPIVGDVRETLRRTFLGDHIEVMKGSVSDAEQKILRLEEEIDELNCFIRDTKEEIKKFEYALEVK